MEFSPDDDEWPYCPVCGERLTTSAWYEDYVCPNGNHNEDDK